MIVKTNDSKPNFYSAALELIREEGNNVVFGGRGDLNAEWGEYEGDEARPIEKGEFTFDKRFWLFLGKPEVIAVGFSTVEGFEFWIDRPNS